VELTEGLRDGRGDGDASTEVVEDGVGGTLARLAGGGGGGFMAEVEEGVEDNAGADAVVGVLASSGEVGSSD
jgi:hypothetical protein